MTSTPCCRASAPSSAARRLLAGAIVVATAVGCARNPVTGERELMLVSEAQEIEMGRQAAQQVPIELGLVEDPELEALVADNGRRIAAASERPDLPWEFHVVDSPVVNAFALPGGFIYLTRGILVHMNSEAEMVGVLGHEIGHVTARHSAQQLSRMQLTNLGLGLSMVFVPEVRPFGDLLSTGLGLLFLKFSRDDESQADRLGVRYSIEDGFDPRRMAAFFEVLDRLQQKSGQVVPTWLSTHPDPSNREQHILEWARQSGADLASLAVHEDDFKRKLEGTIYGEDPREGFMDGHVFKHPDLRFELEFPDGWQVENTRQAVYAGNRDGAFQLTASRVDAGTSPARHASAFLSRYRLASGAGRSTTINGFPAYETPFQAQTQAGALAGEAVFLRDGDRIYEMLGYTSSVRYAQMRGTFLRIADSFTRLDDPRALGVQPQRVRLYRVPGDVTARRALVDAGVVESQLEELAIVNHVSLDETIPAGSLLKSVTEPTVPRSSRER